MLDMMSKSSVFIVLGICFLLGLFGILYFLKSSSPSSMQPVSLLLPTPTPTPVKPQEVHSLDGKMNLIMTTTSGSDGLATYTFSTSEVESPNPVVLYEKTVGKETVLSVPANSWSPENEYVYIVEETGGLKDYLVLNASGKAFSNGDMVLSVGSFFEKYKDEYNIKDITGWDAPQLLHVKTTKTNGEVGQLFWFEVPSQAFVPLFRRS